MDVPQGSDIKVWFKINTYLPSYTDDPLPSTNIMCKSNSVGCDPSDPTILRTHNYFISTCIHVHVIYGLCITQNEIVRVMY